MPKRLFTLLLALLLLCSGCGTAAPTVSTSADSSAEFSTPDASVSEPAPADIPLPDEPSAPPAPKKKAEPPAPAVSPSEPPVLPPAEEAIPPVEVPLPPEEHEVSADVSFEQDVPAVYLPEPQIPSVYDFSVPVAESTPVGTDYFANAAFVGDSRMEGFWLYSGVKQGKLLCATGLTVFSVDSKAMTGGSQTVLDALCSGSFDTIYLAFGLNELGYIDKSAFVQTYCQLIDTVRAAHPDSVIYIQNLIPVNDSQARSSGHAGHVNCDRIRLYNELIAQIALEKKLPLLDLYSAFAVDGQLPAEASRDGVHPLPAYYKKQLEYLRCHTVTREQLTAQPVTEPPADIPVPEDFPETEVTEL